MESIQTSFSVIFIMLNLNISCIENSVDTNQLVSISWKPADQDLPGFQLCLFKHISYESCKFIG